MRGILTRSLAGWLLFAALLPAAGAEVPVPALERRVTDLAGILDAPARDALEQRLAEFEGQHGSQVAVLVVPTTAPESIEQYAIRVAERWRLGRQGVDDGVLLLVAVEDRAMRIEVGYGLEGAIPDAIAKRIIAETITPLFRSGDYPGGLRAGVEALMTVVSGEALPPPEPDWRASGAALEGWLPLLLMFAVVAGGLLRRLFGRVGGAAALAGAAGVIVWLIAGLLLVAAIAAVIAFLVGLASGAPGRPWVSGGRGGFGSGHGGFGGGRGGFSGGGGGFGGGGASGRW